MNHTIADDPIYRNGPAVITRSQAIIGNSIFPISSISSVSTRTDTHGGMKGLGAILLILSFGLFASGAQDKSAAEMTWAVIMAAVAIAMMVRKPEYTVEIITHGKTFGALKTSSEQEAIALNRALSTAITQRAQE